MGAADLRSSDLRRVLEAQEMMAGGSGLEDHVHRALSALSHLFPDGPTGFNVVDYEAPTVKLWTDPVGATPADAGDVLARCAGDHPILVHAARTRDRSVLQLADFPGAAAMRHTELWAGVFEPAGVDQQLVATFGSSGYEVGLCVHRAGKPYQERERALLTAARPGFVTAFSAAVVTERLTLFDGALAEAERGYVVVGGDSRTVGAAGWVPESLASGLVPEPVGRWLAVGAGRAQAMVVRDGDRVARLRHQGETSRGHLVEVVDVLAPTAEDAAGLTRREREVLSILGAGMAPVDAAVALGISTATVHKHLEHIYRRLGVTGARAAIARLRLGS